MKFLLSILLLAFGGVTVAQPVAGGSDTIERALLRLVPSPFQATVDARIPAETVLTWTASQDWMRALRQATEASGLRVEPNFTHGLMEITPGTPKAKPAEPSADRAVRAAAVAPAKVDAPPAVPAPKQFTLVPGIRLDVQFSEWMKGEAWDLLWSSQKTWILPGKEPIVFRGPVDQAVEAAVRELFASGLPVRLEIWEGNKLMEITHAK